MGGSGGVLPIGIHEHVDYMGIEKDFTGEFYDIKFEGAEGKIHKRLFKPQGKFVNDGETIETALLREQNTNLGHIARLLFIFLGEKAVEVEAPTYDAYLAKATQLLAPFKKGSIKVNLKVTPKKGKDGKVYSDISNYPNSYIELHVPGQPSLLKMSKSHLDMMNGVAPPSKGDAPGASTSDLV